MIDFIRNNYGTIIVSIILILAVSIVLRKLIKDYKNCDKKCGDCPYSKMCNKK